MMEGRPVTLTCSTDAKPAVLNFTWYKETGSQLELLQTGFNHTYIVSNPTHSTRYRCTAQNQHGQHNATIELDAQCEYKEKLLHCYIHSFNLIPYSKSITLHLDAKCNVYGENKHVLRLKR